MHYNITIMNNYLLSIATKGHDTKVGVIHDPDTKLKVAVVDVLRSKFKPKKGEVRFFVTAGKNTFAFETQGYSKQRKLLVLQMIAWYCLYLGLLEAQIHSSLPMLKLA
jgi:putative NADPH-quinone reductase